MPRHTLWTLLLHALYRRTDAGRVVLQHRRSEPAPSGSTKKNEQKPTLCARQSRKRWTLPTLPDYGSPDVPKPAPRTHRSHPSINGLGYTTRKPLPSPACSNTLEGPPTGCQYPGVPRVERHGMVDRGMLPTARSVPPCAPTLICRLAGLCAPNSI
jgi:hypothetical protein